MSWALEAISKAAEAAKADLPTGGLQEAAVAGLKALEPVAPALERRQKAGVRSLALRVALPFHRDFSGPDVPTSQGQAQDILARLDRANAEDRAQAELERQEAADWAAILGALQTVGSVAAQAALPFLLAAAGL